MNILSEGNYIYFSEVSAKVAFRYLLAQISQDVAEVNGYVVQDDLLEEYGTSFLYNRVVTEFEKFWTDDSLYKLRKEYTDTLELLKGKDDWFCKSIKSAIDFIDDLLDTFYVDFDEILDIY